MMLKPEVNSGIKLSSSTATGARFLPSIVYFSGLMNYPQGTISIRVNTPTTNVDSSIRIVCIQEVRRKSPLPEMLVWSQDLCFFCLTTSNRFDTSKSLNYIIFKDFVMEEKDIRSSITSVLIT